MGRMLLAAACVLAAMAAPSCRGLVFEDRTPCPSWVTVILRNPAPGTEGGAAMLHLWKDGLVTSCGAHTQEEFSQGVTTAIHKGEAAFSGLSGGTLDGGTPPPSLLTVPDGRMFPPWFAFHVPETEYGEGSVTVETDQWQMHNNLTVDVRGAGYEFRAVCHCGVDGFEYPSLALHQNPLDVETETEAYTRRTARIPRQSMGRDDEEKPLLLVDFDYLDPEEGKWYTLSRIDLESYLEQGRYDWSSPLLEDIRMEVELAEGTLVQAVIVLAGWKQTLLASDSGNLIL